MTSSVLNGFKPSTLKFLKELKLNNNRDWFMQNKSRYEAEVLSPTLDYIAAMGEPLAMISPHFNAIPKRMGGSLMRVNRDMRFSKDKTPYKTNIGIQFRHSFAKDVHAPGYYVHIDPNEVFIGIGTWHPPSDALLKIREHIVEHPKKWVSVRNKINGYSEFNLVGDKLKTAPRGFDKDHPLIDDLRWKDFIAAKNLDVSEIQKDNFVDVSASLFKSATPYMKFLCDAVGVPF